ncbi:MAG: hypothetical protein WCK73_14920 [Deltaproteobacteria bacterium]
MTRVPLLALLLLAACASAPRGAPLAMDASPPTAAALRMSYRSDGAIYLAVGRAAGITNSYGANQVVGPNTSLARNSQGRWAGTLGGQTTMLEVSSGRIQGAGVDLTVLRQGEELLVSGLWRNARLELRFQKDQVTGTPGAGCSIDLNLVEGKGWRGFLACPNPDAASMELEGAANDIPDAAMPQWLFAFLGAFPEGP